MSTVIEESYALKKHDLVLSEGFSQYDLRVSDLPEEERPREKLTKIGPKNLSVAELVAIILGVGTKKEEVLAMAQRVLKEYGEKAMMNETNPKNLAATLDIPLAKACQLIASFELGRRFFANRGGRPIFIRTPKQAYIYLKDMGANQKEQLRGLYLNSRYQIVHDEIISVGSLTASIVHPREVFAPAIEYGAVAVLIAHNHPSGILEPTAADLQVTRQLKDAGKVLGINLLDHLIITDKKYKSLMEENHE